MRSEQIASAWHRGATLIQAGYSQDKAHVLSTHTDCAILGTKVGGAFLLHGCDATKGDSGSPLLLHLDDGFVLVAMHIGSIKNSNDVMGVALPSSTILSPNGEETVRMTSRY